MPNFEYAAPLFLGLNKGLSEKLESTNAFALRTLLRLPKTTSYDELLKVANLKNLEHRRIGQSLVLQVQKSIYGSTPNYIIEMFIQRNSDYNLPQRSSLCKIHSFSFQAAKQWNNLPDKLRTTESLSLFRKNFKRMTLSSNNCNCISPLNRSPVFTLTL